MVLGDIGLGNGEIEVYIALLKLGSVPVSKIKEETNLHRTTIYDFLEKLLIKGLVGYVIENNVKFYKATDPQKLLEHIKEKEKNVLEIMPDLVNMTKHKREEINVEVYRGIEGLKTLLNDMLRIKEEVIGFGLQEEYWVEHFPHIMERYFKEAKLRGITERLLTTDEPKFIFENETTAYRYIPSEFFNPTPTFVFGDNIAIIIWEPLSIINIKNPQVADSYKKYFNMLWNISKEKPKYKNPKHN